MKKTLLILPLAAALVACGQDEEKQIALPDAFAACEQIEVTEAHMLYKCPSDQEWIQAVKTTEPTGTFIISDGLNLAEMYADAEHTYVEVALNNPGFCQEDYTIRTMVADPTGETPWAVIGCK